MDQEAIDREECKNELVYVWSRFSIYTLLHAIADIIEEDTRMVEQTGLFPEEVEKRDTMVLLIRKAASDPLERDK